jgi:peroxiredoxin
MNLFRRVVEWVDRNKQMTNLVAGQVAPEFSLKAIGGREYSLSELVAHGPAVVAFFKISCPVCQFTFPFLQRLHERFGDSGATFVGISQDDSRPTRHFNEEHGVNFLTLLDPHPYSVSNAYGLTNVPTIFLIESDRTITSICIGFSKSDLENIAANLADRQKIAPAPLFRPDEIIPAYKPG